MADITLTNNCKYTNASKRVRRWRVGDAECQFHQGMKILMLTHFPIKSIQSGLCNRALSQILDVSHHMPDSYEVLCKIDSLILLNPDQIFCSYMQI
jgi:hypothetical protein